jgi:hypothetical protein
MTKLYSSFNFNITFAVVTYNKIFARLVIREESIQLPKPRQQIGYIRYTNIAMPQAKSECMYILEQLFDIIFYMLADIMYDQPRIPKVRVQRSCCS